MTPRLDIIVPCYNEQEMFPVTIEKLMPVLNAMIADGLVDAQSRLVFVDDGSKDRTWAMIAAAHLGDPRIGGVKLSRNAGQQNALLAGLGATKAECAITIDADLQDDIHAIPKMVALHRDGAEIVLGVRDDRSSDTAFKRMTADAFYRVMRWFGAEIVPHHSEFRLMGRRAIDALADFQEVNLFLRGLVPLIGFPVASVFYERLPRKHGESKYPFRRMMALAIDGITSFSSVPLRLISRIGAFICAVAIIFGLWAIVAKIVGKSVPGWTSIVVPIYFLGGVQMLSLGIIGEYLAKIYFETKRRPRFIIETTL